MTLPEVVKKIREKKGWNQREMALAMGLEDQQRISEMENAGPTWVKHWEIFLKLLPLCAQLHISLAPSAQELIPPTPEEVLNDVEDDGETAGGPYTRRKSRLKKKSAGPVQAGGIKGNRWKLL